MTALLASNDDVQTFLGDDKLTATDGNSAREQVEAQRLIVSQLSGVFTSDVLVAWVSPATTPGLIRSIAGRIIAAYLYRNAFINESVETPDYGQFLYNEAIAMLRQIRLGTLTVLDADDNPIAPSGLDLSSSDFWPNNTTDGPAFTMGQVFS
jgi:hypothetical protein